MVQSQCKEKGASTIRYYLRPPSSVKNEIITLQSSRT